VLLVTWFGEPTSTVVDVYAEWMTAQARQARDTQTRFIIIGDTTRVDGRPSPDMRRLMAQALQDVQDVAGDSLLRIFTVIDSALLRTVINMTMYLMRQKLPFSSARSIDDALSRALALLDEFGIPRPDGLDPATYEPPGHPMGGS